MSRDPRAVGPLLHAAESDPSPAMRGNTIVRLSHWDDLAVEQRLQPLIELAAGHEDKTLRQCAELATHIIQNRKGPPQGGESE